MKIILKILLLCFMQVLYFNGFAQSNTMNKVNDKIKHADDAAKQADATLDNTIQTLSNAKKIFDKVAANTTTDKNIMTIVVSGISFNNIILTRLEDAIKKVKGTKKVSKSLQSGVITITLKFRHNANDLWNKIPYDIQKMYTPVEVVDKSLLLDH